MASTQGATGGKSPVAPIQTCWADRNATAGCAETIRCRRSGSRRGAACVRSRQAAQEPSRTSTSRIPPRKQQRFSRPPVTRSMSAPTHPPSTGERSTHDSSRRRNSLQAYCGHRRSDLGYLQRLPHRRGRAVALSATPQAGRVEGCRRYVHIKDRAATLSREVERPNPSTQNAS